jgi:hypothetical protein
MGKVWDIVKEGILELPGNREAFVYLSIKACSFWTYAILQDLLYFLCFSVGTSNENPKWSVAWVF